MFRSYDKSTFNTVHFVGKSFHMLVSADNRKDIIFFFAILSQPGAVCVAVKGLKREDSPVCVFPVLTFLRQNVFCYIVWI